ncbi:MAG: hypothetical protein C4576_14815 [Desulfobacteraceae bacterium]|nr:MAG: hypothetical protein C4576_14815 [Desulfobacteraceae bacterium]
MGSVYALLIALGGFMVGQADALVRLLPYETYYYLPFAFFVLTGVVVAGLLVSRSDKRLSKRAGLQMVFAFLLAFCFGLSAYSIVQNALGTRWLLFGILPTNDARDFLDAALSILGTGEFETPRGRPLSDASWAGALAIFDLDLFDSIMLFTGMSALAVVMAALTARRALGAAAAAILAASLFDYIHEHIGGVVSETPGFILGLGGFACVIHAAKERSRSFFLLGFTFLSAAMVYRIGALFILPALLIWAFRNMGRSGREKWGISLAACVLFVSVFWANGMVTRIITPTSGGGFVNAMDSWYATIVEGDLALGRRSPDSVLPGTRWVQIYEDNPELRSLRGRAFVEGKQKVFVRALRERPLSAIAGGGVEIRNYLFKKDIFAFIDFKPLRYLFLFCLLLGVGVGLKRARVDKDPVAGMLLWSNLGIVVSQPFLYGGEVRVPAPTVAFTMALVCLGATGAIRRFQAREVSGSTGFGAPLLAGLAALGVILLSAMGVAERGEWSSSKGRQSLGCPSNAQAAAFSLPAGSGLTAGTGSGKGHLHARADLEEGLRRQGRLNSRFCRIVLDEPIDVNSSRFLTKLAEYSNETVFGGIILDRFSGKPIPLLIPDPKPHDEVLDYCIAGSSDQAWRSAGPLNAE